MTARAIIKPDHVNIGDYDLMSLADAANMFPTAKLTKSSLRTEAAKGNLTITRIANKDFVTKADLKEMVEKCRKNANPQGLSIAKTAEHGSSVTGTSVSAQDALKARLAKQTKSLPSISPPNTSRKGEVVRLR